MSIQAPLKTLKLVTGIPGLVGELRAYAEGYSGTSGGTAIVHGIRVGDVVSNVFQFSDGTDRTSEFVSPATAVDTLEHKSGGTDLTDEILHVTVQRG